MLEIDDRVVAPASFDLERKDVGTLATFQPVIARTAIKAGAVVSGVQPVVAVITAEKFALGALAVNRIISLAAVQLVFAGAALDRIVPGSADQDVIVKRANKTDRF